jgi:hypothetical protein
MQDVYTETGALTLPLRVAMVSSKVAAVLKGIQQRKPLTESSKQSLRIASEMLDQAAKGGAVLRDKSMAQYSADAMSAYRLVQETYQPEEKVGDPAVIVEKLTQVSDGLRRLADGKKADLPLPQLRDFFTFLTRHSLDENAVPGDVNVRMA